MPVDIIEADDEQDAKKKLRDNITVRRVYG